MAPSRRGYSKAQMCFFKILHTISSIPPSPNTKGLGIDLNLTFSSLTDSAESESSRSDVVSATDQGINNEGGEQQDLREKSAEQVSEAVAADDVELESEEEAKTASLRGGESNCLDLLIEAVRVLSGKEGESEEERELRSEREKRKERWVVVDLYGDVVEDREREPVVRSKRGRNQALPYRFRDSVVEPLKRSSRPQRPSSTPHLTKRPLRSSPTT